MGALGSSAPAAFSARKLLTPQLVEELLEALAPLLREPGAGKVPAAGSAFEGQLGAIPLFELLEMLCKADRSGMLNVGLDGYELYVYLRSGAIVFVSCNDAAVYLRGAPVIPSAPA